jgi:DNA-directed RNA polymerase subunit RPC12/RpoP
MNLVQRMLLWWQKRRGKNSLDSMQVTVEMASPEYTPQPPKPRRKLLQADPVCPYCGHKYEKIPSSKTKCPSCGEKVMVRSREKIKRLMTTDQAAAYDQEKKERAHLNKIRNYLSMARLDPDKLQIVQDQMMEDSGKEVSAEDAVLRIIESSLRDAKRSKDYEAATWICFARTHFLRDNDREFFSSLQEWHRMRLMDKQKEALRNREDIKLIVSPGCKCAECKKVDGRVVSIDQALRDLPLPVKGCAKDFPFMGNYWWQFD